MVIPPKSQEYFDFSFIISIFETSSNVIMENLRYCVICGSTDHCNKRDGKIYCRKHYLQLWRYGKVIERTIYDGNEWVLHEDYAECKTYKKDGSLSGIVKVDKDKVDELKQYKIYCRKHRGNKYYAVLTIDGKKTFLHRYLMGLNNVDFTYDVTVDHINGDSLDDRLCNLRICKQNENMKNIKKNGKIVGVSPSPNKDGRWVARIMHNYKTINLGYFVNYADAVMARLRKEKEICGKYGPNDRLYYLLEHPSPIEELNKILSEGV